MYAKRMLYALLLAALTVSALAIAPFAGAQEGSAPDYWPTEGWRTSTPEEQGMDSEKLVKMVE
jgi:hypothetical protein